MIQPHLIVVAGPPAAGKTTLARRAAAQLHLALICKDTLKESLFDCLGARDRTWSQRLGYASIRALYALARDILRSGASLIMESTFIHPDTPGELQTLLDETGARLSVVYCYAAPEVLCARFNARALTTRHPGHGDPSALTPREVAERGWSYRPDYPGTVIEVDTSDFAAVDVRAIAQRLAGFDKKTKAV